MRKICPFIAFLFQGSANFFKRTRHTVSNSETLFQISLKNTNSKKILYRIFLRLFSVSQREAILITEEPNTRNPIESLSQLSAPQQSKVKTIFSVFLFAKTHF